MNSSFSPDSRRRPALCSLDRRQFLATLGVGAATLAVGSAGLPAEISPAPNIVLIVADDLGYGDLGIHGGGEIPTPHIDALASGGVRFSNGYVSCPVCSPTRAGLLTGRYQQRFGHWYNPGPAQDAALNFGLPLDEITLPQLLKKGGYATGMVGKWHLGYKPEFHPLQRGFDEFFGFLGGSHPYLPKDGESLTDILRGTDPVEERAYLTDAFTREAVHYVSKEHQKPFFLYLPYNAVHAPMQAPQAYLDRFQGITDQKRRAYAAMLSALDDGVGAVVNALRDRQILDKTLVVFLSDNGGPPTANASRNTPLSGAKGSVREGGIRVPFFMHYPSRIPSGRVYDQPVISLDILPTLLAVAGSQAPMDRIIDGVDLLPFVSGERSGVPHDRLFWAFHEGRAIREGNWKLMKERGGTYGLYDVSADIAESNDRSADHEAKARELREALTAWESELKTPLWESPSSPRRAKPKASQT